MRVPARNFRRGADSSGTRSGFTLLELLVVITIIVILLTMTLLAVNFTRDSDRVSSAAQQIRSFIEGARDRAIYAKEARGVRLFVSAENPRAVTTMAYIAPGGTWSSPENSSEITLLRIDGNVRNNPTPPVTVPPTPAANGVFTDPEDVIRKVRGQNNPGWWNLKRRGWLVDGLRIRIPKGPTGIWYPIDTSLIDISLPPSDTQTLLLQVPYADVGVEPDNEVAHRNLDYELELPARLLAQDPAFLPEGVIIDLDGSKVPTSWRPANTGNTQYSGYMDIVFSPRGNLVGEAAGAGVMHLYVCDGEDSKFLKERFAANATVAGRIESTLINTPFIPLDEVISDTSNPDKPVFLWYTGDNNYLVRDRRLVTIASQTGNVSVHEVNAYTPANPSGKFDLFDPFDIDGDNYFGPANPATDPPEPDGLVDDPYAFAESGRGAK
jgi:prepilin-type N-terminal cleavage/methylation domain-containing protein